MFRVKTISTISDTKKSLFVVSVVKRMKYRPEFVIKFLILSITVTESNIVHENDCISNFILWTFKYNMM